MPNAALVQDKNVITVTEKERARAANLIKFGIKPLDALHLALAETGNADYFCTRDDQLLRNAKRVKDILMKVVSPVDLVQELER